MRSWWDDAEGIVLDDRYALQERIGRGGAGVVHRAWDRARERAVAVKLLPAAGAVVDARTGRQEAEVLRALDHPQLVALHDVLTTEDGVALVMELVDGPSLVDRLEEGTLPLEDARVVLRDVAAGLAHAHARGIVHRDVKPGNVLLRQADQRVAGAALADFGIARFAEATRVTTAATILGTIRYLSPEQVRGERATAASDVYSLGLTLLGAITGHPVFPGSDAESLAGRLVRSPEIPADLPADWAALLTAMTALRAEDRPAAADVSAAADRLGSAVPLLPLLPVGSVGFDEETRPVDAAALLGVAASGTPATEARRVPRFVPVAASLSAAVAGLGLVLILAGTPVGFDQTGSAELEQLGAPTAVASPSMSPRSEAVTAPRAPAVHEATTIRSSAPVTADAAGSSDSSRPSTAPKSRPSAQPAPKQVAHGKSAHDKGGHKGAGHSAVAHQKAEARKAAPRKRAQKKPGGGHRGGHGRGHGGH